MFLCLVSSHNNKGMIIHLQTLFSPFLACEKGPPLYCLIICGPLPRITLVSSQLIWFSVPPWAPVCMCVAGGEKGWGWGWFMLFHPLCTSIPAQPSFAPLSEHPISHPISVQTDSFSSKLKDFIPPHVFSHRCSERCLSVLCMWHIP